MFFFAIQLVVFAYILFTVFYIPCWTFKTNYALEDVVLRNILFGLKRESNAANVEEEQGSLGHGEYKNPITILFDN